MKIVNNNKDNILRITDLKRKGKPFEYAVKMKEIAEQYRLDNLLFTRKVSLRIIRRLVEILVRFHIHTRTSKEIKCRGRPQFINEKINGNFDTISKLTKVDGKLRKVLLCIVEDNQSVFLNSIHENKIRDIRGDLHLENIFIVQNNFYLYDKIEFNDSLRYADIAEDVAHLCIDLDRHKRTDFQKYFISQYIEKSNDLILGKVVYFWMCYKACVRAKVSLFHAKNEADEEQRDSYINEAKDLFLLANSYIKLL